MTQRVKTRDYFMKAIILGSSKAGAHRDNRKHASATACRGKDKMIAAKKKAVRSFDWTRPALHGDELFEICLDEHSNIVEAYLIDEDDNAIHFNLSSFNEEEMQQIRELALA